MQIVEELIRKNIKISTAESCTGGLLAKKITDISGASGIFEMGVVTYSNGAKIKLLSVPKEVLDSFGAVSSNTAEAMSKGITKLAGSDIGVGVTGIAGPNGGTIKKPVGLVYFSIYIKDEDRFITKELRLKGSRDEIRQNTVSEIFREIEKFVTALS